jgi:hypothetical protein
MVKRRFSFATKVARATRPAGWSSELILERDNPPTREQGTAEIPKELTSHPIGEIERLVAA